MQHVDPLKEARSPGLLLAPFTDHWAVYDLLTHSVHLLQPFAGLILDTPVAQRSSLVTDVAEAGGQSVETVEAHLADMAGDLVGVGLLGRTEPWEPPEALTGSSAVDAEGQSVGPAMALLDHRIAFRSSDGDLLGHVEALLGIEPCDGDPTGYFDVEPDGEGGILLEAAEEWHFPTVEGFDIQLPGAINDFVSRSSGLLVLHGGAVRTPAGEVIVVPGLPEAGKSTLTAALVAAGCDYLGDEIIGVRPDSRDAVGVPRPAALDMRSREVLGLSGLDPSWPYVAMSSIRADATAVTGDAGPIDRVVMARFDPAATSIEQTTLAPRDALEAMLPAVFNIVRCGEGGWVSLCRLAGEVPVTSVTHPDAPRLAEALLT